ncbi:hypothetical protein E1B28_013611 [Marasmius oreades]|uniref:DUF6533 domain-containing protein n=1 Tax=Marasmius oreades TaxID=181124 RepID=A0A9P7UMZ1_9AGAR|nr:uncharacterized protein E1B28_013611 [Marasmius oreades]KAG7087663.1 hypothetical protein E1B28_013611 [Marasmius oreades]
MEEQEYPLPLIAQHLRASIYVSAAGLVMLIYDHILTFSDEVELIWRARWTTPKALFLILRYFVPPTLIIHMHQFSGLSDAGVNNTVRLQSCSLILLNSHPPPPAVLQSMVQCLCYSWYRYDGDRKLWVIAKMSSERLKAERPLHSPRHPSPMEPLATQQTPYLFDLSTLLVNTSRTPGMCGGCHSQSRQRTTIF